jgi:hypothetical protein
MFATLFPILVFLAKTEMILYWFSNIICNVIYNNILEKLIVPCKVKYSFVVSN